MATAVDESWCGVERLSEASVRCAKRKGGGPDAIGFRMHEGQELLSLAARLGRGQVGRFVEVPRDGWRLGLRRHWAGRRMVSGLPWRAAAWLIERGPARGYVVAVALEEPEACGNVKRRRPTYLFERPLSEQSRTKESP